MRLHERAPFAQCDRSPHAHTASHGASMECIKFSRARARSFDNERGEVLIKNERRAGKEIIFSRRGVMRCGDIASLAEKSCSCGFDFIWLVCALLVWGKNDGGEIYRG